MKNLTSGGSMRTCGKPKVGNPDASSLETYRVQGDIGDKEYILNTEKINKILNGISLKYGADVTQPYNEPTMKKLGVIIGEGN